MRLTNTTPFPATWTTGFTLEGREAVTVIAKSTWRLPDNEAPVTIATAQRPLVQADTFTGTPGWSAPVEETDFVPYKPACDVLLLGSAHAPDGRSVIRLPVGLRVGNWSRPEPFVVLPIGYDTAFGGTDTTEDGSPAPAPTRTYAPNPVGRGFGHRGGRFDGLLLPSTEEAHQPIESPGKAYRPMAFSPIGRNWAPRRQYTGTYDDTWRRHRAPLLPTDFDERYFQVATADQVIPYPVGNEFVSLLHLTSAGSCRFQLPGRRMPITFIPHQGHDVTRDAVIDTLVFRPDEGDFTITWRTRLPLGRSVFDVREVVVGERSAAWHRARRKPGKLYVGGLGALVTARRERR